jgi:signal transduction histidine kinase
MDMEHRDILDSLGSGLLAVDVHGKILFLNGVLAALLGVETREWAGRPASELARLVQGRSGAEGGPRLEWTESKAEPSTREIEWRNEKALRHFREDSVPLRDSSGKTAGRLFAYHDISREKTIDRMKSEFIAVASHELRTPMTSIKGSVDLILSGFAGETSPEMQELLEIAQKSCDRLVRLVNDILDLSKIESGQLKLNLTRADLTEIAVHAVCAAKPFADQADVRLRVERPRPIPLVEVDKDRMEQVITNLISNAVKFSPPKTEVLVEIQASNGWVQCSVIDKGCGIAERDLHRIFGKFQQVGEGRRRGGTGLGLAITQALLEEHGGMIWVESRVNEGSKFIFRVPALEHTLAPEIEAEAPKDPQTA